MATMLPIINNIDYRNKTKDFNSTTRKFQNRYLKQIFDSKIQIKYLTQIYSSQISSSKGQFGVGSNIWIKYLTQRSDSNIQLKGSSQRSKSNIWFKYIQVKYLTQISSSKSHLRDPNQMSESNIQHLFESVNSYLQCFIPVLCWMLITRCVKETSVWVSRCVTLVVKAWLCLETVWSGGCESLSPAVSGVQRLLPAAEACGFFNHGVELECCWC